MMMMGYDDDDIFFENIAYWPSVFCHDESMQDGYSYDVDVDVYEISMMILMMM